MEGKDYPLRAEFEAGKALDALRSAELEYSLDGAEPAVLPMLREGNAFTAVIPGEVLKPGQLSYIIRLYRERGSTELPRQNIRIISRGEAYALRQSVLSAGLSLDAEKRAPFYRGPRLKLSYPEGWREASVVFNWRRSASGGFSATDLPSDDSSFDPGLGADALAEGPLEYYFTVRAPDPDFGSVEVTVPRGGREAPASVTLVGRQETERILYQEMDAALKGLLPHQASAVYDLTVSASFSAASRSYLAELLEEGPRFSLEARDSSGRISELASGSLGGSSAFTASIPASLLGAGTDSYRLKASLRLAYFGELSRALGPGDAEGFIRLAVLDDAATRELCADELGAAIRHNPPVEASEVDSLDIYFGLDMGSLSFFGLKAGLADVDAYISLADSSGRIVETSRMGRSGSGFSFTVPASRFAAGVDRYAFSLQARSNTRMGSITVPVAGVPGLHWYRLRVLSRAELRAWAESSLASSLRLDSSGDPESGQPLVLEFRSNALASDAIAFLFVKRPGEKTYTARSMGRDGSAFRASIAVEELLDGQLEYFAVFSYFDSRLGVIEASFPAMGGFSPLRHPGVDAEMARAAAAASLAKRLSHKPLVVVSPEKEFALSASLRGASRQSSVVFRVLNPATGAYDAYAGQRSGDTFSIRIPASYIPGGSYFLVATESLGAFGPVSAVLPGEGGVYRFNVAAGE
jgi:hypothetical protein